MPILGSASNMRTRIALFNTARQQRMNRAIKLGKSSRVVLWKGSTIICEEISVSATMTGLISHMEAEAFVPTAYVHVVHIHRHNA